MSTESLISNFDYLTRVFGIQAFNKHGERIFTDDEIIELVLPHYLKEDPWNQYAMAISLAGIRRQIEFYAKIQEIKNKKENCNETLD